MLRLYGSRFGRMNPEGRGGVMLEGRGPGMALVDLGAALLAGALWYVRPELGPLPLVLLVIGFAVRHFSDPPVEYEVTALDAAVALFLVSAGIGLLIAYDWNVALEKFYVIVGAVGIYGALVRVPGEIELGGRTVRPINLLLGVLPTAIAAYYVATADYSLQIGKLPFLDPVFEWISSWQPSLPGHKLHPNVAGGLIAALLPLQVLALAELAGAESAVSRAPGTGHGPLDHVPGRPQAGRPQGAPLQSGRLEGGGASGPGGVVQRRSGGLEGGGASARGIPPLPAWEQANGASVADRASYHLGWRGPGIETVLVVISLVGLVLSASRGAWAALVLVAAVWALVSRVWPSQALPAGGRGAAGAAGLAVMLVVAGLVAAPGAVGASFDAAPVGRSVQDARTIGSTLSGTEPIGVVQSKGASFDYGLAPFAQDALVMQSSARGAAAGPSTALLRSSAQDALSVRSSGQDAEQLVRSVQDARTIGSTLSGTEPAGVVQSKGASFDYAPSGRSAQDALQLAPSAQDARGLVARAASFDYGLAPSAQDALAMRSSAQGALERSDDAQEAEPGVVDGRAELLRNSLDLAWDTAFTGIGLGGFQMAFSSYILLLHVGHTYHSHNLFLNVWLEQGLLGLGALVWLLLAAVVAWRRVRRLGEGQGKAWAAAALAAIAVIAVHGMVDDAFYGSRGVLLLFVPFALLTRAQADAVWSAYEPPTLTEVLMSRNGFIAGALLAFVLLLGLTPPVRSQFQANLGALSQTQAEMSVYEWPTWPIQDALRRDIGTGPGPVDLRAATGHYEAALAIDENNEVANRRLGQIALSRGDYPAAGELLTTAYYNDYTNRAARQMYGEWLAIDGRADRAKAVLRTVDVSAGQLAARVWWYESIGEMEKAAAIRDAAD